jgi:hypothetical protein
VHLNGFEVKGCQWRLTSATRKTESATAIEMVASFRPCGYTISSSGWIWRCTSPGGYCPFCSSLCTPSKG